MLSTEAFLSNNCRVLGTLLKIWLNGDVKWHSGLVWAFNSSSPGAPGSNPKHTNYTFYWYIWYMLPTYCHLSQSSSREIKDRRYLTEVCKIILKTSVLSYILSRPKQWLHVWHVAPIHRTGAFKQKFEATILGSSTLKWYLHKIKLQNSNDLFL